MKSVLKQKTEEILNQEEVLRQGGGKDGHDRQRRNGRLPVRERLSLLFDKNSPTFELGIWAGYEMYKEWGSFPAAGVVTIIGKVSGKICMVIANDATVKAGAMFPQSIKKTLRAQRIAFENKLPILYLVDSSGVFLPLQDEIFPDEDDFGRIFRNNAILSANGIPQFAAIMGNCIAGGGYLPVLCDKLLMTKGSGLYLAGPALVKAAIGQEIETEALGGAEMHATISGTVDFVEENDESCLKRLRKLVDMLPNDIDWNFSKLPQPQQNINDVYSIMNESASGYDMREIIYCIVDKDSAEEYKANFGKSIITMFAKINNQPIGIVANQRKPTKTSSGKIEIGGVIYTESADKIARFVMDCNQMKIPILFLQDVSGFMVGREAEQSGIIKSGAKVVNAISNSIVPKITIIIGNSFGAGHYALCGRAYDPHFIFAWPNTKYAVMGADQASDTIFTIQQKSADRKKDSLKKDEANAQRLKVKESYETQMDIRYGAARGWVDAIIPPHETREILTHILQLVKRSPITERKFHTGVLQV
ncbi:MAG: acyl-CoA carboxylase subunit beta [Bacteroidetes bacterium]|nr:acyl-CoA carboxylase subunit beta [Bacteroidota bacterium]